MTEKELIKYKLKDKNWRIFSWVLYKIKDKDWNIIPFIPNGAQTHFYNNKHTKNIILKARQLWFSTLIDIDELDDTLFSSYHTNWIIAQDKDKAKDLYDNKVKFAYDNLPKWLLDLFETRIDRQWEIKFENNNCSISVGTSFRSWTLQYLHISEYWKICAKYPEKAREIKTGSLNAIWPKQEVTIESTAEWASGDFYEKSMKAMQNEEQGKELSDMDYKFFFYPWYLEPSYEIESNQILKKETLEYFEKIKWDERFIRNYPWCEFTKWQILWYQIKEEEQKDDMKREYPSTPKEAFELSVEWAYYEKELWLSRRQGRICKVAYEPSLPVHTVWDLWGAWWWDETAIWFIQIYSKEIRIIDYFEWNGMSMIQIINFEVLNKDYIYWKHILPHDWRVTEFSTWITRESTARELLHNVDICPSVSVADWINQVRQIFSRCYFDEENCSVWLMRLWGYHKKYVKSIWKYIDEPDHTDSHWPDAFRYMAISFNKMTEEKTQKISIQNNIKR
jgi:hypothetical protein